MFQKNIDELFQGLPNMFGIAGDILFTGFNGKGRDNGATLVKVLRICSQPILKLSKYKCLF